MSYLLDTNVLLRSVQKTHPAHNTAVNAIQMLLGQGATLWLTSQNLIEFWAVATRPAESNGLGWTVAETIQEIADLKSFFTLQPDTPVIFAEWEKLVAQYQVMGKQVHDARLVAVMKTYQIPFLLTFNIADFKRFTEIIAIAPSSVSYPTKLSDLGTRYRRSRILERRSDRPLLAGVQSLYSMKRCLWWRSP
jgi:predicted nucleic acid-binding protein